MRTMNAEDLTLDDFERERRKAAVLRLEGALTAIHKRIAENLSPDEIARLEREIVDAD